MTQVHLLVDLVIADGRQSEFKDMFIREFIARSRGEAGCQRYELWQDREHTANMTILEVWDSKAHLDMHMAQDCFKEWGPRLEAMLAEPLRIRFFDAVEVS